MDLEKKLSTHWLTLKGKDLKDIYKCVAHDVKGKTGSNDLTTHPYNTTDNFSGSGDDGGKI